MVAQPISIARFFFLYSPISCKLDLKIIILILLCISSVVSEDGASVYSICDLSVEEFPKMDPNLRSAVSIARRLQDPLMELVKIEPKSLGVGMYQVEVVCRFSAFVTRKRLDTAASCISESDI